MTCTAGIWKLAAVLAATLLAGAPEPGEAQGEGQTPGSAATPRPDLTVRLTGPVSARAGEAIDLTIRLSVANVGAAPARGTRDHSSGYMVDLTLGRDTRLAVGFKAYSPHFAEDVLLEGGRVSKTADIASGASKRYPVAVVIPADVVAGSYHLCAYVDPGNVVAESDEANNAACSPMRINTAGAAADRHAGVPPVERVHR